MKKNLLTLAFLCAMVSAYAQTWTGTTSTAWNVATNWSTGTVPTSASNVIIPGALSRYPKLAAATTINGIEMQTGSSLDVNGFPFTLNGSNTYISFTGVTLSNSSSTTDIVLNINTGINGFNTSFNGNTIQDNVIFNLTGDNAFNEGNTGTTANSYMFNTTYNIGINNNFSLSSSVASLFNGNLTMSRSVAGNVSLFNSGGTIHGNFSYQNLTTGVTAIGNLANKTAIDGSLSLDIDLTAKSAFSLLRVINQTSGGGVSVKNSTGFDVESDTLKLTALNISGYQSPGYAYLLNNSITATTTISDDITYDGGYQTLIRSNLLNGNTAFTFKGPNSIYESDDASSGNTFNGSTSFTLSNTSVLYMSRGAASHYNGNLTVSRTAAGETQMFTAAGATISGNFAYSNTAAGNTTIGTTATKTSVSGTINLNADYTGVGYVHIYHVINQVTGGNVLLNKMTGIDVINDSLKLASFAATNYLTGGYATFENNTLASPTITVTDDTTFSGGYFTLLRNNIFTGNTALNFNGPNNVYEGDQGGSASTFNGPVSYSLSNSSILFLSSGDASVYNGNLTVNRTGAGESRIFLTGGTVNGNFSFVNNTSGSITIGSTATKTAVSGSFNLNANYNGSGYLHVYRVINQVNGGSFTANKLTGIEITADTLKTTSFALTNNLTGYVMIENNHITASSITVTDDVTDGNGYYTLVNSNVFTGNSSFGLNGTNNFYDANVSSTGNIYNGNTVFNATNTGEYFICNSDSSIFNGNVTINRTVAAASYYFRTGAKISGNLSYTNNVGGVTVIGNTAPRTNVAGTVNIVAGFSSPAEFTLRHLNNQTAGGNITVQNSGALTVENDTLKVGAVNLNGYSQNYASLSYNDISGNVSLSDDATFGGGYFTTVRGNIIGGTAAFTLNGSNNFYDADAGSGNQYSGNVSYTRNGSGAMSIGNAFENDYGQGLSLNSSSGISINNVKFTGSSNGVLQQLGTQVLSIPLVSMAKTGSGYVTLGSPLTITSGLTFGGGNIHNTAANALSFPDGVTYTGASNSSHITGKVIKTGNIAFVFPIGTTTSLDAVAMTAPATTTDQFSAQYFKANPTSNGYDTSFRASTLKRVSGCEYWDVERIAGGTNVGLTFSFAGPCSASPIYISDPTKLKVARWTGSQWGDLGNGGSTGTTTGTLTTAAAVSAFGPFSIASTDLVANALPVHLISFSGIRKNTTAQLQWVTNNEDRLSHFEVEKSQPGTGFTALASVTAHNISGVNNYMITDAYPAKGINYYRLKQVDQDNKFTYSNTVAVDMNGRVLFSISPNPVLDKIIIAEADVADMVRIIDARGRTMFSVKISKLNQSIFTGNLAAGIYMLQLVKKDTVQTVQFLKQ